MGYPASTKDEIIRLVEQLLLPVKRALQKLSIPRTTFYRRYDVWGLGGIDALEDYRARLGYIWNRVPDSIQWEIVSMALDIPELSPRERAVRFTDERRYFVSESSVYRLLDTYDLINSSAFIAMNAANDFPTIKTWMYQRDVGAATI